MRNKCNFKSTFFYLVVFHIFDFHITKTAVSHGMLLSNKLLPVERLRLSLDGIFLCVILNLGMYSSCYVNMATL